VNLTFTNRTGGVSLGAFASLNLGDHVGDDPSAVAANRRSLVDHFGPVQFMNQVHGDRIVIVEEVTDVIPEADALVSGIPGIALAVMVADCIPLILTSKEVVAAVHVGRRGLVNDIARKTIRTMEEMGAGAITAHIGPAICGTCYEVSNEVFKEVTSKHPATISQTIKGTPALDLIAGIRAVLSEEGLDIKSKFECTVESPDLFSYRRDGVTGRQAGIVSL
jgi:YfiH family protein